VTLIAAVEVHLQVVVLPVQALQVQALRPRPVQVARFVPILRGTLTQLTHSEILCPTREIIGNGNISKMVIANREQKIVGTIWDPAIKNDFARVACEGKNNFRKLQISFFVASTISRVNIIDTLMRRH